MLLKIIKRGQVLKTVLKKNFQWIPSLWYSNFIMYILTCSQFS